MPNINDLMGKPKFRAWNKDILKQLKIEKPFKKEENPVEIEQKSDENVENKPTTNLLQSDHKVTENLQQTYSKPTAHLTANLQQTYSKPTAHLTANLQQTYSDKNETYSKLTAKPTAHLTANLQQTYSKPTAKVSFSSLVGLQREILLIVFSSSKFSRSKITEPLTMEHISKVVGTTARCAKDALQRLEKKGLIKSEEYKNGRGGWSKYSIPDSLFQELINIETYSKPTANLQQSYSKVTVQPTAQPTATPLSSSSININNITTTTTERDVVKEIGEEYKNIDSSSLEKIGFGFTQISQLFEKNIDPNLIQESINHFAFALENNEKIKQNENPLNLFMGVLRKGRRWVESNYEPVQTIELRALLELKKKEKERYESLLAELFELEYNTWFTDMTDEELKKLLPNADFKYGRHVYEIEQQAKILFKNTKWIKILNKIKKPIPNQL